MKLEDQARAFLEANPGLRVTALCPRENLTDLQDPWGIPLQRWAAEDHSERCTEYLALNRKSFPNLPLPGWVLSDVYLLTGGIVMLTQGTHILSAWVGLPFKPGVRLGVSLFSQVAGWGAWTKSFGAAAWGVHTVRGVVQWNARAIRTHLRLGPLRIVGRIPGEHELGGFVYETALEPEIWASAMQRTLGIPADTWIAAEDSAALQRVIARCEAGERWWVVGVEAGRWGLVPGKWSTG